MKLRKQKRPEPKRAAVVGAGSYGTAIALLLVRSGLRTTLITRTDKRAAELSAARVNAHYLGGVSLPRELRIVGPGESLARSDAVFLAVPSQAVPEQVAWLASNQLPGEAALVSLAKGLTPPNGKTPTDLLSESFDPSRIACIAGPAHAREMVTQGAGLVAASTNSALAQMLSEVFRRSGVVCEASQDRVGVELAGITKNVAALASGATVGQGLNAAGAAAGSIFSESWKLAAQRGAKPESLLGFAGIGDLMATALASESRNRRAGELLGEGVPGGEIAARVGQAVEALETAPLLAATLTEAGIEAPTIRALSRLIAGELSIDQWVALVRTLTPQSSKLRRGPLQRLGAKLRPN